MQKILRNQFLIFLIIAVVFINKINGATVSGSATSTAAEPGQLNVLFIVIDDLRNDLGCYGCKKVKSPNIDKLAESGLRFDNAYVQATFCNPSRTSFLTGLRPNRTGIHENRTFYRKKLPDVVTLPQLFRKNGYYTGGYGKIFHGHSRRDSLATWDKTATVSTTSLGRRGKGRNLTGGAIKWCSFREAEGDDEDQSDGQLADCAIEFLKNRPKDKPFFLAVGFHKPHDPFVAPKRYFDFYPLEKIKLPHLPPDRSPSVIQIRTWKKVFDKFTDKERKEFMRAYYACSTFVDAQVGKVLAELDRLKLRDRTIVFFLSDHGYHLGEHGWWNKNTLYEFSCRSPLIVSVPGMKSVGKGCQGIVEFIDIFPTLAELCGLTPPGDIDGRSFRGLIDNPAQSWKKAAFSQYGSGCTVRTKRWRFSQWKRGPQHMALFDHSTDPEEYYNLAEDPANKKIIMRMERLLKEKFPTGSVLPGAIKKSSSSAIKKPMSSAIKKPMSSAIKKPMPSAIKKPMPSAIKKSSSPAIRKSLPSAIKNDFHDARKKSLSAAQVVLRVESFTVPPTARPTVFVEV